MSELTQTQLDFREGMSRLGAAVNLITTDGSAGKHGVTASAVCSVTDAPPTLIVCINKGAYAHDKFVENGVLAVNVLASEHQELSGHFARFVEGVDRFSYGCWTTKATGSPVLSDANVAFDCRIVGRQEQGTHSVFFCEVAAVRLADATRHGLVWFSRAYHHLMAEHP
jgi:flavin reductase